MTDYELSFTIPSPGKYASFAEFSQNGRFLAVGDRDSSLLSILDRCAGFHKSFSVVTPAKPTALVWETSKAFYVGLSNGQFAHYQVDIKNRKLVEGAMSKLFHGTLPITAMALDQESKTMVLSMGPGVFAFRRIRETSTFRLSMN